MHSNEDLVQAKITIFKKCNVAAEIKAPDECCRLVVQVDCRNSSPGRRLWRPHLYHSFLNHEAE